MAAEQTPELAPNCLKVFEARFGDKNGAIALLKFPPQLREFFLRLSDKADLPDSAPAGATWEPFIRGWRHDDHYLITLTEADQTAVRPGMIATRMFAIPLSQAQCWDALEVLFELLRNTNRDYTPELFIPLKLNYPPSAEVPPTLLACVAHHLIHEYQPAIIIGQSGFDALVATLWRKLPAELRVTLGFGFSFTPPDLITSRANIVAVPSSCEARWSSYKFKCDVSWKHPLSNSTAAFLGDTQANGFLEFLCDVGLEFSSFSDYGRYSRLWDYWQMRHNGELDALQSLLRSLGTLRPEPDHASKHKAEAMRLTAALLKNATPEGILALRSVKASAFRSIATILGGSICEWIKSRFQSSQASEGKELAKIILAIPSSQSTEWQEWVRTGFKQAFIPVEENTAQIIWSIWSVEGTLSEIGAQLPVDKKAEIALVHVFPATLPPTLYSELVDWCTRRGWISLMAKTAFAHIGFSKAVQLVLNQNIGESRETAIKLLCAAAKPSEIWASALEHIETDLLKYAVTAAKKEPILWTIEAPNLSRWVELLESAAKADPAFMKEVDINSIMLRLFHAWEKGFALTEPIYVALEKAERLEFSGWTNRSRLWAQIPRPFLTNALSNTLRAWLKDYYFKQPQKPDLEKELVAILFERKHIDATFPPHSTMLASGGLNLIEKWGTANECELWLNILLSGSTQLNQEVATRAGELIRSRSWGIAAKMAKAIDERFGRSDFRPIWEIYYKSLGLVEKLVFDYFLSTAPPTIGSPTPSHLSVMNKAVFVTALPEEFEAVKLHLTDCKEYTENGTIYEIGRFYSEGAECTVAVVQTGMGNALSAAATERALNYFKPDFALLVGIAGGLRDDLKIGYVVAASKVYGYESGKSGVTFQPRPEAPPVSHAADQRANAVVRAKLWQKRIIPTMNPEPEAIVRPIAAGEKVLTSMTSEDMRRLKTTFTDAYAVAMEDYGFAIAAHRHSSVCFAVVRGISDLIENKQAADHAGSHEIAARNAAAFAFEMLAGLLRGRTSSHT